MSDKNKEKKPNIKSAPTSSRRFLLIFICAFISIAIILGAVLGIISAVKKSRAAVSFRGVVMETEVASYFATLYKYNYMSMLRASGVVEVEDSYGFWNKDAGDGATYGDLLKKGTTDYIKQIMITNYLYDRYGEITSADKKIIANAVRETLEYKADGDKEKFDKAVAEYGFSYSSFEDAALMMYKAGFAQNLICGEGGANMSSMPEEIDDFLSEYSHVKLLFIRTETTFELDSSGNRVTENDGSYVMRDLTDEEKAERAALISEIRGYINSIGTGEAAMGEEMFDIYLNSVDEGDADSHKYGYYFHEKSDFTKAFKDSYAGVIDEINSLSVGGFGEAEVDFGVCFIYKCETDKNDLQIDDLEFCFSDFYTNLSDSFFAEKISAFTTQVEFDKKYEDIDVLFLPYNYIYIPSFG